MHFTLDNSLSTFIFFTSVPWCTYHHSQVSDRRIWWAELDPPSPPTIMITQKQVSTRYSDTRRDWNCRIALKYLSCLISFESVNIDIMITGNICQTGTLLLLRCLHHQIGWISECLITLMCLTNQLYCISVLMMYLIGLTILKVCQNCVLTWSDIFDCPVVLRDWYPA